MYCAVHLKSPARAWWLNITRLSCHKKVKIFHWFCTDIHVSQRMTPNDFADPLTSLGGLLVQTHGIQRMNDMLAC